MKRLYAWLSFLGALLIAAPSYSTHLVGGSMSYEYLGLQNNGQYRYRISVFMYRDCYASTVPFDDEIEIGIYNNNSQRTLARVLRIPTIVVDRAVDPPSGGSDCDFQPDVCIKQAIYQGIVDLPSSTLGYHLMFRRCCRNTQVNIIDDMGQTFYAYIPNTAINNSSPYFTDVPSPYICRNDLVSLYNTAKDKDGDSLVYEMNIPWSGGNTQDPAPSPPATMPGFNEVIYRQGYDETRPFGNAGVAEIDYRNGVTTLLAPQRGLYSIAIDVTEYRNGVKIGQIRLDIQMIVIDCPPNAVPDLNTSTNTENYEIKEGEALCFDVIGTDSDNDNIKLTATSDLFDGSNPATFNPKTGTGNVRSTFCWTPPCGSASETPKQVTFEVQDDGCPYKKKIINVSILVKPFVGVGNINGPSPVCAGATGQAYNAVGSAGSSYFWEVSGGTITSGQGSSSILVNWDDVPTGTVKVTETSAGGCQGQTTTKTVTMRPTPPVPTVSGPDSVCEFSNNVVYSIPATANYTYSWSIQGGTINSGTGNNAIQVNWGAQGKGWVRVVHTNNLGCSTASDTFKVAILRNSIDSLYGSPSICPNAKGVAYEVLNPKPLATYVWAVTGGNQASGGNSSRITIDWGGVGMGSVSVYEINKFGCISNTLLLSIEKNHKLKGMVPAGPDTLCENSSQVKYEVIYSNGSKYIWGVQGGVILQNDSSASVLVDWGSAGNGRISVYEVAYDSVTNTPCISDPLFLDVFLAPYPTAESILGPDEICQSNTPQAYSVNGFPESDYQWNYTGGSVDGQGNSSITITPDQFGTFTLSVIETTQYGCAGPNNQKQIIVHPRPVTEGIYGEDIVCYPNYTNRAYSVSGYSTSTFNWWMDGGDIINGQGDSLIQVNFNGQQDNSISVQEISDFGCPGDTLTLDVFADNPSLDMYYVSVVVGDDSKMETKWELINAPRYNSNFRIQRRLPGTGPWKTVGQADQNTFLYTDAGIDADQYEYEYRIVGFNLCGDSIFSEPHKSIRLKGAKAEDDDYAVNVDWTGYLGWTDGVERYQLIRVIGGSDNIDLENMGQDSTAFFDDGEKTYRQCYRVKAYELNGNEVSYSNEICFNFNPILFAPSAFTPNDDGLNDQYTWSYASIKSFEIRIYDRWGELIYTGTKPDAFWNGVYKSKLVPDGVYAYVINYTGYDDRLIVLKGNITVLK